MEAAFADSWPAGLFLPEAEGGGVCGRLLLAWLPKMLSPA
jgi:hypothetical protein